MGVLAQGRGSLGEYEEGLNEAMLVQRQLLDVVRGDHPELVAAHRQAAADMQSELASLYASQHKLDQVRPPYPSVCISSCLSVGGCIIMSVCLSVFLCQNVRILMFCLSGCVFHDVCLLGCVSVCLSVRHTVHVWLGVGFPSPELHMQSCLHLHLLNKPHYDLDSVIIVTVSAGVIINDANS